MIERMRSSPEAYNKVGETLFLVLDRYIDLDKPTLLAKMFTAYLGDVVTAEQLQRLAQAIDAAHPADLHELIECDEFVANGSSSSDLNKTWLSTLTPSGLTISHLGGFDGDRMTYALTPLGALLWRAAHFQWPKPSA